MYQDRMIDSPVKKRTKTSHDADADESLSVRQIAAAAATTITTSTTPSEQVHAIKPVGTTHDGSIRTYMAHKIIKQHEAQVDRLQRAKAAAATADHISSSSSSSSDMDSCLFKGCVFFINGSTGQ